MAILQMLSACLPPVDSRSANQIDQDIVEELEFHITMLTEDNMDRGMPADAARVAALAQFGNFAAVQQKCRRALLGTRIMWQRIQFMLSAVLIVAVVFLAFQLFSGQRANQAAIDKIASSLNRAIPPAVQSQAANDNPPKAAAPSEPVDPNKSYAIELKPDSVREFATLAVDFGKLKLRGEAITVVPISTAAGVTGAVLLGSGQYSYIPAVGKEFAGHFRAAMLRFNPKDADAVIKLADGKGLVDKGALELRRAVIGTAFRRCYHAGQEALIPAEKAIAVDVFSQELGEVLMSGDNSTQVVFDFTSRRQLFPEK